MDMVRELSHNHLPWKLKNVLHLQVIGSQLTRIHLYITSHQNSGSRVSSYKNKYTQPSMTQLQPNGRIHPDDDDAFSVASTVASMRSVRSMRSRVTVPTAPTFRSSARAEQRKEFYTKLEEKHKALEAEKNQCEARTKEEQEVAIKQLRKSMVVKANPVPSFYYEGPPPKPELKKCWLLQGRCAALRQKSQEQQSNSGAFCSKKSVWSRRKGQQGIDEANSKLPWIN